MTNILIFPPLNSYRVTFFTPMLTRRESRLVKAGTEGEALKRLKFELNREKRRYHNTYFHVNKADQK